MSIFLYTHLRLFNLLPCSLFLFLYQRDTIPIHDHDDDDDYGDHDDDGDDGDHDDHDDDASNNNKHDYYYSLLIMMYVQPFAQNKTFYLLTLIIVHH